VTDIGSGTDELTVYLAARYHLTIKEVSRVAVGAGTTFVAALQPGRIACGMTTRPTAGAIQTQGIGTSVINLATTSGARQWLGGAYPDANAEGAGIRGPHAARSQFPILGQEKTPRLPGPRRSW
jgi:NitT/TauT family transport system substrate-binding protein